MAHSTNKIDTINFAGTSYDVHDAQAVHLDDATETVSCTTAPSSSNSFRILMTQTSGVSGNPTTLSTYVNDSISTAITGAIGASY